MSLTVLTTLDQMFTGMLLVGVTYQSKPSYLYMYLLLIWNYDEAKHVR